MTMGPSSWFIFLSVSSVPCLSFLLRVRSSAHRVHPIKVFSTTAPEQEEEKLRQQQLHTCAGCNQTFKTRNSLFRHLRGEDESTAECPLSITVSKEELLMTAIIRYGYYHGGHLATKEASNDMVANLVHDGFVNNMNSFFDAQDYDLSTSGLTYSSACKLRQPSLRQDKEVAGAASEMLSLNYRLRSSPRSISKWKEYASNGPLQERIQSWLDESVLSGIRVELHKVHALVPRSSKFSAERSCTQSSYRYLMPVDWIMPRDDGGRIEARSHLEEWLKISGSSYGQHQPRVGRRSVDPPLFIKQLKQSLKAIESETVPNRRLRRKENAINDDDRDSDDMTALDGEEEEEVVAVSDSSPIRLAHGRFGQLWRKRRRCWSNFASPKLSGMSCSPNRDAIWRTIDRAKIRGFVNAQNGTSDNHNSNTHLILEFQADGFVLGQIPRLVSTLVAMTNGWLPETFFDAAMNPDIYLPAPPAPPFLERRLYFYTSRYHFHELTSNGEASDNVQLADIVHYGSDSEDNWESDLQQRLLNGLSTSTKEEDWLLDLRDKICIDLREQLRKIELEESISRQHLSFEHTTDTDEDSSLTDVVAPDEYKETLGLLRSIVSCGQWPATSDARSRVIKSQSSDFSRINMFTNKKGELASTFPGRSISSGSFTVVNDSVWDGELPFANTLFPNLVKAVFELEKDIIRKTIGPISSADGMERRSSQKIQRPPSTHCAVNRNAQFTPHVDSGRGNGQSVSMIAGLGNYLGGEILVEGQAYDIQYQALEFDGWKQQHWTAPFRGERYSLVWFTPASSQRKADGQTSESLDDLHAAQLAANHSKAVPFLPPLQFRLGSTDSVVINEILDEEKDSAYTNIQAGFDLKNHKCFLDIGAHIGVASRLAIACNCLQIIAYEPEPSNFELLSQNLKLLQPGGIEITLHSSAVAHEYSESEILVEARNENDGKKNTWRHSLQDYSQYVDRSTALSSESQQNTLQRFSVRCIPFFGSDSDNGMAVKGALVPGVSCVKMDCEGAEVDILLSSNASKRSSWLDVTHLVVEWSFTKERRVSLFHKAMHNLREAGFQVYYDGMGSWWDKGDIMWPYPNDIIVFAIMNE